MIRGHDPTHYRLNNMLRQLGYWETAKLLKHNMLAGHDNLVLRVNLDVALDKSHFIKALEALYERHVLLRCRVKEHVRWFSFYKKVAFDEIETRWHQVNDSAEIDAFMEQEMTRTYDHALWRAHMFALPDGTSAVCLSLCHAIVDVINATELFNTLLTTYDALLSGQTHKQKTLADKPPIETFQLHRIPREQWIHDQPIDDLDPIAFEQSAPIEKRRPHRYHIPLSADLLNRLEAICQRVHVPFQSVLVTQAMLTLQDCFPHKKQCSYNSLMDMRHAVRPIIATDVLGHYTVDAMQQASFKPHNLWQMTTEYGRALRQIMPELVKFPGGRWNPDHVFETVHIEQLQEGARPLVDLSVESLMDLPLTTDYSHFHVTDFDVAQNSIGGAHFFTLTLTRVNDNLHLLCHYAEPLVSKKTVKAYGDALLTRLEAWANEQSQPR